MQFFDSTRLPSPRAELVCRQSRLGNLVVALITSLVFVGTPLAGWLLDIINTPVTILIGCVSVPLAACFASVARAAVRPTNWLLSIEPDGLLINLRSFRNAGLPNGQTVVHLAYGEIVSVRQHVASMSAPSSDGTLNWREKSLDLEIAPADAELVRLAVAEERNRRSTKGYLRGFVTVNGRANHVPVLVVQGNLVRLLWRSRYDAVTPSLKRVVARLENRVRRVATSTSESTNDWSQLGDSEFDDLLLHLIETNDIITAVAMLKQRRGYSTTAAKRFVDEVTGRLATTPTG